KLLHPLLQERYSRPGALGEEDYRKPSDKMRELEQVIDMKQLRTIAYAQLLDPSAFIDMMQDAYTYWKQLNCSVDQLTRWIMAHMDQLPKWKPVADVPVDFNLIAFAREQAPQALLL